MKQLSIIILSVSVLLLSGFTTPPAKETSSATTEIEWLTIDEAQARQAQEPRPMFVDVYTDWCGWCKRMDRDTFSNEEVVNYVNSNYYAVKLNAESTDEVTYKGSTMSQTSLARTWKVSGYPTIVLINAEMSLVQAKPGFRKPNGFMSMLRSFAK